MAKEIADSTLLDTWSSSGLKVEPDISKIIEGWQLGEQPPHEYMNWLQNTFGSKLNHILKNGVAGWNNETEYLAGSSVQHNGNVWLCKTTNTNSAPTDVNTNWKRILTVEALITVLAGYVATTGNQTIDGVKTFSSNIVGNITGNAESANHTPTLSALDNYVWSASTTPTEYPLGVQTSFVNLEGGFPDYGSVVNVKTYLEGGGSLQLYVPYGTTSGGDALKVRFGNYSVNSGNSWTSWKTLATTDGNVATATNATYAAAFTTAVGSAPSYACRAWVNFNGTGTVAIRASGNVSSITDNGVGDYTVNFTTAMPDANYGVNGLSSADTVGYGNTGAIAFRINASVVPTVSAVRVVNTGGGNSILDCMHGYIAIFR